MLAVGQAGRTAGANLAGASKSLVRAQRSLLGCNRHAPQIPTLETGEINYDDLKAALVKNAGKPAILNVNIGTTVKGAVDDLDRVLEVLKVREGAGAGGCSVSA